MPSRIREGIRPLGYTLEVASTEAAACALASACDAALVNLTARRYDPLAVIRALKTQPALPVLAFVGHVEREKQVAARDAGADLVVANSSVSLHLATILGQLLGQVRGGDA